MSNPSDEVQVISEKEIKPESLEPSETIPLATMDTLNTKKVNEPQKNNVDNKLKWRIRRVTLSILICLIIIIIPFAVLGYILYQANLATNTPIIGNRFDEQHQPAITEQDMTKINSRISGITGVEKAVVETIVATTRISVDCSDTLTAEEISDIANQAYAIVNEELPIETYYTNTDVMEMYDLEITVFNNSSYSAKEEPYLIMVDIVKNGMAEGPIVQVVSSPKNEAVAQAALQVVEERKKAAEEAKKAEEEAKQAEENGENGEETENNTETPEETPEGENTENNSTELL